MTFKCFIYLALSYLANKITKRCAMHELPQNKDYRTMEHLKYGMISMMIQTGQKKTPKEYMLGKFYSAL